MNATMMILVKKSHLWGDMNSSTELLAYTFCNLLGVEAKLPTGLDVDERLRGNEALEASTRIGD